MSLRRSVSLPLALALLSVSACGSRTDLSFVPVHGDGGVPIPTLDASRVPDVVPIVDAPPPFDATSPVDAPADASRRCSADGGPTRVAYLLDGVAQIWSYDPPTGTTTLLGAPMCDPITPWTATFSATTAYILYTDASFFAVDLHTLACRPISIPLGGAVNTQVLFAFAYSETGGTPHLYYEGAPAAGNSNLPVLGVSDVTSFVITRVGEILPTPSLSAGIPNLTSDSAGNLFAFSDTGYLQVIDEATARVTHTASTGIGTSSWANVIWGGEDYLIGGTIADAYDYAHDTITGTHVLTPAPCGGGSVPVCP